MKKFATLAAIVVASAVAAPASVFAAETAQPVSAVVEASASSVTPKAGKMLYASDGRRVASIYRINPEGNPQVILNSQLITVPASTLSDVEGKITTSLTKSQLTSAR